MNILNNNIIGFLKGEYDLYDCCMHIENNIISLIKNYDVKDLVRPYKSSSTTKLVKYMKEKYPYNYGDIMYLIPLKDDRIKAKYLKTIPLHIYKNQQIDYYELISNVYTVINKLQGKKKDQYKFNKMIKGYDNSKVQISSLNSDNTRNYLVMDIDDIYNYTIDNVFVCEIIYTDETPKPKFFLDIDYNGTEPLPI
jgi:hypothetical protein